MSGLNEQNPDRGIETWPVQFGALGRGSLNEQNPDRGIETMIRWPVLGDCNGA